MIVMLTHYSSRVTRKINQTKPKRKRTFEVFSRNLLGEPPQHMFFVLSHPFDVGYGLLYGLFQSQGGGAKTNMEVVFFKLLQLEE